MVPGVGHIYDLSDARNTPSPRLKHSFLRSRYRQAIDRSVQHRLGARPSGIEPATDRMTTKHCQSKRDRTNGDERTSGRAREQQNQNEQARAESHEMMKLIVITLPHNLVIADPILRTSLSDPLSLRMALIPHNMNLQLSIV